MSSELDITTVAGDVFTHEDSARMAAMVYTRFGRNMLAACAAWHRLLENNTGVPQFKKLVIYGLALIRFDERHSINASANHEKEILNLVMEITMEVQRDCEIK